MREIPQCGVRIAPRNASGIVSFSFSLLMKSCSAQELLISTHSSFSNARQLDACVKRPQLPPTSVSQQIRALFSPTLHSAVWYFSAHQSTPVGVTHSRRESRFWLKNSRSCLHLDFRKQVHQACSFTGFWVRKERSFHIKTAPVLFICNAESFSSQTTGKLQLHQLL